MTERDTLSPEGEVVRPAPEFPFAVATEEE